MNSGIGKKLAADVTGKRKNVLAAEGKQGKMCWMWRGNREKCPGNGEKCALLSWKWRKYAGNGSQCLERRKKRQKMIPIGYGNEKKFVLSP